MARGRNPVAWYAGALHAVAGLELDLLGWKAGSPGAVAGERFNRRMKQGFNDQNLWSFWLGPKEPTPVTEADEFFMRETPIGRAQFSADRLEDIRSAFAGFSDADLLAVYSMTEALCQERGLMG